MRIEKISENMIKVTISLSDLEERNIDLNSLNYNSPATQELFWDMMEQAEVQFGFTASDAQLVFEASQDSDDGFVVTITRMDEGGDFESIHKYIKNKYKISDTKVKKKSRKIYTTLMIYSFSSFEDVCALCHVISLMYSGDSTLYKCRKTYYLVLTKSNLTSSSVKSLETFLKEYGNKVSNASFYDGYLNEYGTKMIDTNAIKVMNEFF
jgi:adapter protein MecA 1/2